MHSPVKLAGSPERNRRLIEFMETLNEEDFDILADIEEES